MSYRIGVSSGIFGAAQEAERIQYAGLAQKAHYCITKGVQFVQLDLESVSEFREPDLKEKLEKVKGMGVTFGIHSETRAFGVEVAELDSAIETDYKFGHERLREVLEKSGEIGSKYLLIHSSESEPFLMLERHMQPAALVDFFGNPLRVFVENNAFLIEWLIGGSIEEVVGRVFNVWLTRGKGVTETDVGVATKSQEYILRELFGYSLGEALRREMESTVATYEIHLRKKYEDFTPEETQLVDDHIRRELEIALRRFRTQFLEVVQSRTLHYGPERIAYYITAKWMEKINDPLWKNIVNATIEYFAKVDGKIKEEWLKDKGIKELTIDDENFRRLSYIWVPAVSAKYIWGHLNQDKVSKEKKVYADLKEIIKKYKMPLVLETPMAHRGIEEWLRLPNPIQMYYFAKEIGIDYIQLALDFEHMISIKLEPEKVIGALPKEAGNFVRVIHAGWPSPLAPAHIPIPIGSEQQSYIYKMLYLLRQKGFGKKDECYVVFERGGGPDPIQQSILALRKIVEFLEKDTPPEKLPLEFYGIGHEDFLSPERQMVIIREHARDPLRGLIVAPEEEHTALGRAALEKPGMTAEKWKKEELR